MSEIGPERLDFFLMSMLQIRDLPLKVMIRKPFANAGRSSRDKGEHCDRRAR
jgi:hypothetical protein